MVVKIHWVTGLSQRTVTANGRGTVAGTAVPAGWRRAQASAAHPCSTLSPQVGRPRSWGAGGAVRGLSVAGNGPSYGYVHVTGMS